MLLTCTWFLLSNALEAQHHNRDKDKYAIIDCWSKRFVTLGEVNEYTNLVKEGRKIKWRVYGPENTIVKIVFEPDPNHAECSGTPPDDNAKTRQVQIDGSEHENLELKVKEGKGGTAGKGQCYVYKVYCGGDLIPENAPAPAAIDPIIEVPRNQ